MVLEDGRQLLVPHRVTRAGDCQALAKAFVVVINRVLDDSFLVSS
jgi:hypothetical protein